MSQSCSSLKKRLKYAVLNESAQRSSRSMFIDPVGIQSVPIAMFTPSRAYSVTRAVSPYSVMFERGDQMRSVLSRAISAMSVASSATPWMNAACGPTMSLGPVRAQRNSLRADCSMPSAMCGVKALYPRVSSVAAGGVPQLIPRSSVPLVSP
jgi:hypothetical protein